MIKLSIIFMFFVLISEKHLVNSRPGQGDLLGPAEVIIKNVQQCENPEQYPFTIFTLRKKLNRTHDVFDGNATFPIDWDDTIGVKVNVAKWGDGGYKPNYYVLDEKNSCDFLMQYVGNGFRRILRESNKPEKCPISKGTLYVNNYMIDYRELPSTLIYGDFRLDVNFHQNGVKTSCTQAFVVSKPKKIIG